MFDRKSFESQKLANIDKAFHDTELIENGRRFVSHSDRYMYGYNWTCLGLPVIQMPEDIVLMQELIWDIKPDFVVEAGVAWGGSLALYAMIQELLGTGKTIGIDVTIPAHNKAAIMGIPVAKRIQLIEGSSIDSKVVEAVTSQFTSNSKIMVVLDSNHSHEHVLEELRTWSEFVTPGSYLVVSDTIIEHIPLQTSRPRPWGPGNNPQTAVTQFLSENSDFTLENNYNKRAINSFSPGGYLLKK